ncbi:Uncharacterized protein HZ326_24561 [Fusarium oxysporum f. sp. albedinis]|nr:Uncharacterized protein HZ326_24561 [Fusarium oxysporum f. sp. albedinis]
MQQMPYGRPYNDVKDVPVEVLGAIRFCFGASLTIYRIVGFNPKPKRHPKFEFHHSTTSVPTACRSCATATSIACSCVSTFAQSPSMFTAKV